MLGLTLLLILAFPLRAFGDIGIYLETGRRILAGQLPYVDYQEINLPTFHYLNVLPVFASQFLPMNSIGLLKIMVWLTTIYACLTSLWLTRRALPDPIGPLLVFVMALYSFSLLYSDYGEREQVIWLLFVPWLLLRWRRWDGDSVPPIAAFAIGFLACLAASIKPYFVPLFIVPELYGLVTRRSLRPLFASEVYGAVAFVVVVIGYIIAFPQVLGNYLSSVLPAVSAGYGAWGNHPIDSMIEDDPRIVLQAFIACVAFFIIRPQKSRSQWSLARWLGMATLVGMVGYLLQSKGLNYHRIPFEGSTAMLLVLILYTASTTRRAASVRRVTKAVSVFLLLFVTVVAILIVFAVNAQAPLAYSTPEFNAILERYSVPGDAVLVVDTHCCPTYPGLQQVSRVQASRYIVAHPIPFAYYQKDTTDLYSPAHQPPPLAQQYLDHLVEDIALQRPPLILIGSGDCVACPAGFDLSQFLEAQGIIADVIEPNYDLTDNIVGFRVYRRVGT